MTSLCGPRSRSGLRFQILDAFSFIGSKRRNVNQARHIGLIAGNSDDHAAVGVSAEVVADEAIHEAGIEVPALSGAARLQNVGAKLPQLAAEPRADRNRKSLFASRQGGRREDARGALVRSNHDGTS